jgi:hypothetical protein
MSTKVVKILFAVDEDTAARIAAVAEVPIKERSASDENFTFTDLDGKTCKLYYVVSEEF